MEESIPHLSPLSSTSLSLPVFSSLSYDEKIKCIQLLHNSAKHGDLLTVVSLIEYQQVPIDSLDDRHFTPLMHACEKGRERIVQYLIAHGADVNAKEEFGDSPLVFASSWSHLRIVHDLLLAGADVNTMDAEQDTPLTIAAAEGHTEVCSLLLRYGARIDIVNETGWTPLEASMENAHADTVALLLDEGNADPTGKLTHEAPRMVVNSSSNNGTSTTIGNGSSSTTVGQSTSSSSTHSTLLSPKRTLSSSLLSISSEDLTTLVSPSSSSSSASLDTDLLIENEIGLPSSHSSSTTTTNSIGNYHHHTNSTNNSTDNSNNIASTQRRLRRRFTMRDGRILARARELAAVEAVTLQLSITNTPTYSPAATSVTNPKTDTHGSSSSSSSCSSSSSLVVTNPPTVSTVSTSSGNTVALPSTPLMSLSNTTPSTLPSKTLTPYADVLARILGYSRWRRRGYILVLYNLIIQNRAEYIVPMLNATNIPNIYDLSIHSPSATVAPSTVPKHMSIACTATTTDPIISVPSDLNLIAGEAIVRLTAPCVPFDIVKRILSYV